MSTSQHIAKKIILITLCSALSIFLLTSSEAQAVEGVDHTINRIISTFHDNATSWEQALRGYAASLFWILAGIEFTWSAIRLSLKGADLNEFLAELASRVLYIGFFYFLLMHSSDIASGIVQSFRTAADSASGAGGGEIGISPVNVLQRGLEIVTQIWASLFQMDPMRSISTAIAGIVILICFALMAANMIEALIESYIVISAGVLFMGFGGSRWTDEYAKKAIIYALAVGAKLFVIQLIMGLGERLIKEWTVTFDANNIEDILVILGASVVMVLLSKNVPSMVQGLVNGSSLGAGGTLASMAFGAAGATAAVAGGVASGGVNSIGGMVAAGHGAYQLASEQAKESESKDGPSSGARRASMTGFAGQMAKNMGKAGIANIGQRFRGEHRYGNRGAQMGHEMSQQAERLRTKREGADKPDPPKATTPSANGKHDNRIYGQDE